MTAWLSGIRGILGSERQADERGSALVEFSWLAILLLVPLVYVVLAVFDVQRGAYGVTAASRAAARAFTLAEGDAAAARRDARAAAATALRDQGVDDFTLTVRCVPANRCRQPGATITVVVRTQVRLPLAPDVFGGTPPSFRVQAVQRLPVPQYVEGPP